MNEKIGLTLDLRGVDMVTPIDLLSDGRTPWSKNFRLYAQQSDDRQVAISSRKGPGYYMNPRVETLTDSKTGTPTRDINIGVTDNVFAQRIKATVAGRLSRLDIKIKKSATDKTTGPILVTIYSIKDGRPSDVLSESSFAAGSVSSTYQWLTARFHKAQLMAVNDEVFAVIQVQDDGVGIYQISGVEDNTSSQFSDVSFAALTTVSHSANFRAYVSPDERPKGGYRYNPPTGNNITVAAYGTTMYGLNPITNTWTEIKTGLNALAYEYSFAHGDNRVFWVNGFDNLMCWDGTFTGSTANVETITDTELPILRHIAWHKLLLWGVPAAQPGNVVFSEGPGSPSTEPANKQWYRAWRSTDVLVYNEPVNGLVSFQDSLTVFTQNTKYIVSGYDRGNFIDRQSTGAKGAVSSRGIVANENFIFFVADDGLYSFDGSRDENLSEKRIQPLFDACPRKNEISPVIWKNKVRWYMASETSSVNDICPIYSPGLGGEWEIDLETYVDRAIYFNDADDNSELLELSSHYAMPMLAEQGYNSLGAPIDFEYRLKYDSFGTPAQKKRLRRYFPILQGVDNTFKIQLKMDKDFQDNPRIKDVLMQVQGSTWGDFNWGDGTLYGGDKSFKHHRQSYSGSAYYWQLRVSRKGVNNRVAFTGAQYKYRIKRM